MNDNSSNPNGSPPSVPGLTGVANAVGLGNPSNGAPGVQAPDRANFNVPGQGEIAQALETLKRANVGVDQTQLQGVLGQQQQLAGQEMQQLQTGQGPGGSAAEMGTETGLQNAAAQSRGALGGLGAAANPAGAMRQQQQAQAQGQSQAIAQGAQARAGEEAQIANQAQNTLSSLSQGTIAGASQRLQANIAQMNLQQNALRMQMQQTMQQLQAKMSYQELATQVANQNRQDYINSAIASQRNMMILTGAILQAAGGAVAAGMNSGGGSMSLEDAQGAGLTGLGSQNNPYDAPFKDQTGLTSLGTTAGAGDLGGSGNIG